MFPHLTCTTHSSDGLDSCDPTNRHCNAAISPVLCPGLKPILNIPTPNRVADSLLRTQPLSDHWTHSTFRRFYTRTFTQPPLKPARGVAIVISGRETSPAGERSWQKVTAARTVSAEELLPVIIRCTCIPFSPWPGHRDGRAKWRFRAPGRNRPYLCVIIARVCRRPGGNSSLKQM